MTRSFLRFGESKRNKNKGKRSRQVPHTFDKIMGCDFKNARNGKSISKTSKWPSSKPLALKNNIL